MKTLKYYILGIVVTVLIITGATYAFLVSSINSSSNSFNVSSSKLDVIMTGSTRFDGALNVTNAEGTTGAISTTVKLKLNQDSAQGVYGNVYIYMENIPEAFRTKGFKYNAIATRNDTVLYNNSGDFTECRVYSDNNNNLKTTYTDNKKCNNGDKLYIAKDVLLDTEDTEFEVYLWLDGNLVGNEVIGKIFQGYINADTSYFTSDINY